jgi:hypothetical protein
MEPTRPATHLHAALYADAARRLATALATGLLTRLARLGHARSAPCLAEADVLFAAVRVEAVLVLLVRGVRLLLVVVVLVHGLRRVAGSHAGGGAHNPLVFGEGRLALTLREISRRVSWALVYSVGRISD